MRTGTHPPLTGFAPACCRSARRGLRRPARNGFRSWPHRQAQTLEIIGREIGPDGATADLVRVGTELLVDLDLDAEVLQAMALRIAGMAEVLHLRDAWRGATAIAEVLSARTAASAHPRSGPEPWIRRVADVPC